MTPAEFIEQVSFSALTYAFDNQRLSLRGGFPLNQFFKGYSVHNVFQTAKVIS